MEFNNWPGCFSLGEDGWDDSPNDIWDEGFILGETGGGNLILGDVGWGDAGVDCKVGDVFVECWSTSDLGTNMTDAKLSSESTLVSLWRLLSLEESEPSSREWRLSPG